MKIHLDDIVFSIQTMGGISVFWSEFLQKIGKSASQQFCLIRAGQPKNTISKFDWSKEQVNDTKISIYALRALPLLKRLSPKSIFHSSYLRVSLQKDVCNIVTIHDLAAEKKKIGGFRRYLKLALQGFAVKKADGIICVSESTRRDLLLHYPWLQKQKVKTILHGCSSSFFPIENCTREKFILFVGGRSVYKNFATCLKVMAVLKDYQLVLVGGGALSQKEEKQLNRILRKRYKHYEALDTATLNLFYNQAHCLFYPTEYEGFGLPVLEAMSAECAVVSSSIPAIREVAKDGAILVDDPNSVSCFVAAIRALEDESFRNILVGRGLTRAKNFSLDLQFSETMDFYHRMYQLKFGT